MKNFLSKIKTLNYKEFALNHGEKIGMGIVGLVVLVCLGLTNWASEYTGEPSDLATKADDLSAKVAQNPWSDDRKKEFPPLVADSELKKLMADIPRDVYEWSVPFSQKLYPEQQPADEVVLLPVADLVVKSGVFPLGYIAAAGETAADEARAKAAPKNDKKKKDRGDDLLAPADGGRGAGTSSKPSEKVRGVRYNVVLGLVEVHRQRLAYKQRLHLDTLTEAADLLDYRDFRIERQRAVPGPDPWTGPWKPVKTEVSFELLAEASGHDLELVAAKYTSGVFTSPLPHRLDDDWNPYDVVHPKIPTLTEEEKESERIKNAAAIEALSELKANSEDKPAVGRGFRQVTQDAMALRAKAAGTKDGAQKMREIEAKMRGGAPGINQPNRGPGPNPMGGSGMGGMGGMGGGAPAPAAEGLADVLLFRFFDVDEVGVEPGACYRYRVQLVVTNPNFQKQFVSQPSIAEGEIRETPWSAPSPPTIVNNDVEYALTDVTINKSTHRPDGASLNVVQFDPNYGTYIMDKFKVVYGSYVGIEKFKTWRLDVIRPSLKKEDDVSFSSKDIMLDSAAIPSLSATAMTDLNLSKKDVTDLQKEGKLDMAVTLNRFGEIVELDASSKDDLKPVIDRVDKQRDEFKDYKEVDDPKKKKDEQDSLDKAVGEKNKGKKGGKKKGRKAVDNPLKSGPPGY